MTLLGKVHMMVQSTRQQWFGQPHGTGCLPRWNNNALRDCDDYEEGDPTDRPDCMAESSLQVWTVQILGCGTRLKIVLRDTTHIQTEELKV